MGEGTETSENNNASLSSSSTGNEQTDSNQTFPSLKVETVQEPSRAFPEAFLNSGFPFHPNLVGAEAANFGAPLLPMMYPAPFPGFFSFSSTRSWSRSTTPARRDLCCSRSPIHGFSLRGTYSSGLQFANWYNCPRFREC